VYFKTVPLMARADARAVGRSGSELNKLGLMGEITAKLIEAGNERMR
jgi:hypothetical protein